MDITKKPSLDLAKQVLPNALFKTLQDIFSFRLQGVMLVGGTALAGFYAGHRKSDDLDLFTVSNDAFTACTQAVRNLEAKNVSFLDEFHTGAYYRAVCVRDGHRFTIDIVREKAIFDISSPIVLSNGVFVAPLETILDTKISTLVSRCSEKDLYDLIWLFGNFHPVSFEDLIERGRTIDRGLSVESLLLSLSGAVLKKEACDFAPPGSNKDVEEIFDQVTNFRDLLIKELSLFAKTSPSKLEDLQKLVRKLKKLS